MTKETLKMALIALEIEEAQTHYPTQALIKAITAIKETLAQPEQEPVGWAEHGVINWLADKQFNHTSFLYDTPAQRTWVGLTDEDDIDWDGGDLKSLIQAIETKLKEKNS